MKEENRDKESKGTITNNVNHYGDNSNKEFMEVVKKVGKDISDKLQGMAGGSSKGSNTSLLTIGAIVGACILILIFFPKKEEPVISPSVLTTQDELKSESQLSYEEELEIKLERILMQVEGVGRTDVMITTETFYEREIAEEVDESQEQTTETGGSTNKTTIKNERQTSVVLEDGDTPYIIKEYRPEIAGVLIIAEGADNASIREDIINTVKYLLDVESNQVSVLKKAKN